MSSAADQLLDRLRLKQQITRWRGVAIVALCLAAVALIEARMPTKHSPTQRDFIARFTLEGIVLDDPDRDELMADIRDNPKIKALIVRLDTPGGSAVGGMQIYRQLREIATHKPVVAVMRDLSASAGYLAALGADRIFVSEGTITGSIGVIIQTAEFSTLAEKLGVTPITVKTGPLKDALSPYAKATPEALAAMQEVVDDFFQVFVSTVAERRNLPREKVLTLADGRVFAGQKAIQVGLVDAIGGEPEAGAWLEEAKKLRPGLEVRDVELPKDELPWLERLTDSMVQKVMPARAEGLDGLVAIWHPALQIQ